VWNNRKHPQEGLFSDDGLKIFVALRADRGSVLPDVSDTEMLQTLEKAEFSNVCKESEYIIYE
jgi:hypothetical protein